MRLLALVVVLPPVLAAEVIGAYAGALRRNSTGRGIRLGDMPDDGALLPVCSCCRRCALRSSGTGRICPDCDRPDPRHAHPSGRVPPTDETTGGV